MDYVFVKKLFDYITFLQSNNYVVISEQEILEYSNDQQLGEYIRKSYHLLKKNKNEDNTVK